MALLDFRESFAGGRNRQWYATVGAADLPTTAGLGDWTVGDIVWNLNATVGNPASWVCTAVSSSTYAPTFAVADIAGAANTLRSVAGSATLAATDKYLFITAAGTVTLPAPSSTLASHQYAIKATAQPVTITPATGNLDSAALAITISTQQSVDLMSDGTSWFTVGNFPLLGGPVRAITPPGTIQTTDKFITSSAGQLTLAPTAGWTIGQTVVAVASASSVTITPTSGNINGAAALTLATGVGAPIFCDGTNFWTY